LWAEEFPVRREGADLAWLSGGAQLETEIGSNRAASSLFLQNLQVRLPEKSGRSLRGLDPHPDVEIVGLQQQEMRPDSAYEILINVDGSEGFWVRRSDFAARVEAALDVIYVEPELRVGGYVDFQRGTFETLGKSFEINRGSLTFDGSSELNPEVTLTATYSPESAGRSPVVVTVTGTMQQPQISFTSEECEGENGGLVMLIADRCALGESDMMADADAQQEAMVAGMMGGVLTLGTRGVRNELGGLIPKPILQSRQQAYSGNRVYRVGAGVNADSLIPPFLRGIVRGAYLESAYARTTYSTGAGSERSEGSESGLPPGEEPETGALDFLLELRFPYDLVWTGRIAPPQNWGADILWEP
jgi:translocation and assembly module TamB